MSILIDVVIKKHDQKQLRGGKKFISANRLYTMIEGIQVRNSSEKMKQKAWRNATKWLACRPMLI